MKPQAVIFDLDGVVTDTAHLHFLAWQRIARDVGIDIDEKINEQLKGISRGESLRRILAHGGAEARVDEAQRLQLCERKNALYVESLAQLNPDSILPGIAGLLTALRAQGIRTGLASVSLNAPRILAALNLTAQFDFCADAAKVARSKPDPAIFIAACEGLGVKPEQCIGIEDAQAGIDAINACSMASVGIGEQLSGADLRLASTADLSWARLETFWLTHHSVAV